MRLPTQQHTRMSPLAAGAAVSVIVFSMVGVATMTGLLPNAASQKQETGTLAVKDSATPAASRVEGAVPAVCSQCGTVESIRAVQLRGDASGLGAVAGGVTGAVIGNQMGSGRGNTAMTVLGAAGGAYAGHEIERNMKKRYAYRVTVRMDDGSFRTISQSQAPTVTVGAKVRLANGVLIARSG